MTELQARAKLQRAARGRRRKGHLVDDGRENRFGRAVQAHRERLGWTQRELAERLGYESDTAISMIEQDKSFPRLDKAVAMAALFQTTLGDMYAYDGGTLPPPLGGGTPLRELLVPSSRGTIGLRGWTLDETLLILRALKEVGVLFDNTSIVDGPPGPSLG